MLNIEKYNDKIKKIGLTSVAIVNGEIRSCLDTKCGECSLGKSAPSKECYDSLLDWLCEDYKEPEINWDKDIDWERVPVDTEVLVRDHEYAPLVCKNFAIYMPFTIMKYRTFVDSYGEKTERKYAVSVQCWSHCELKNKEDIEKYRKKIKNEN